MAIVHRHDLHADDVVDALVTSKVATLTHCLRSLPFDEALAVADSACRAGDGAALKIAARTAQGAGAARVRHVAASARPEAANPFESCLRAICMRVPGLHVQPQRLVTSVMPWVRPDLVDLDLGLVLEADSFAWHGDRTALRRDAARYNRLVVAGFMVLRFTWEDVMFCQDDVRAVVATAAARAHRRTEVG
jgi:very-short-patch-repair endonuclease